MEASRKNKEKPSGHQQVVEYLSILEHPMKNEIEEVRKIILDANVNITEHIKWNAPSFCYGNDDRITFHLRGKGYIQLIFHRGAKSKDQIREPLFMDETGLLEWITADRASIKFTDMNDIRIKKENLKKIVNRWLEAC
jgi:hypothetical protein